MIQSTLVNIRGESRPIALDVGPMPDNTYAYGFTDSEGWIISEGRYHNAESAKRDARRPQQMNLKANLEPLSSDESSGE
jgi:DNA-binding PucR family transcriptional regulator